MYWPIHVLQRTYFSGRTSAYVNISMHMCSARTNTHAHTFARTHTHTHSHTLTHTHAHARARAHTQVVFYKQYIFINNTRLVEYPRFGIISVLCCASMYRREDCMRRRVGGIRHRRRYNNGSAVLETSVSLSAVHKC